MPKYKCRATMGTHLYCIVEAKDEDDAVEQMKELASNGNLIEENDKWDYRGGFMDYDVATRNSLTGGQIGGDLWVCIVPGVKFGVEFLGHPPRRASAGYR